MSNNREFKDAYNRLDRYLQNISHVNSHVNLISYYERILPEKKSSNLRTIREFKNQIESHGVSVGGLMPEAPKTFIDFLYRELDYCKKNKDIVANKIKRLLSEKKESSTKKEGKILEKKVILKEEYDPTKYIYCIGNKHKRIDFDGVNEDISNIVVIRWGKNNNNSLFVDMIDVDTYKRHSYYGKRSIYSYGTKDYEGYDLKDYKEGKTQVSDYSCFLGMLFTDLMHYKKEFRKGTVFVSGYIFHVANLKSFVVREAKIYLEFYHGYSIVADYLKLSYDSDFNHISKFLPRDILGNIIENPKTLYNAALTMARTDYNKILKMYNEIMRK